VCARTSECPLGTRRSEYDRMLIGKPPAPNLHSLVLDEEISQLRKRPLDPQNTNDSTLAVLRPLDIIRGGDARYIRVKHGDKRTRRFQLNCRRKLNASRYLRVLCMYKQCPMV